MPKEKSAGAVVFRMVGGQPHYLLLHYPTTRRAKKEYWDFPKGHVEAGETEEEAASREIQEETGLVVDLTPGFKEYIRYFFKVKEETIFKTVVFFLAETKQQKVQISFEHKGFLWLPHEKAMLQLKFRNAKRILKKANSFLLKAKQKQG